jgi:hypothetical protein
MRTIVIWVVLIILFFGFYAFFAAHPSAEPSPRTDDVSLWQAIVENSVSRVYLGVHWEFDGITMKDAHGKAAFGVPGTPKQLGEIGGVWLGAKIANALAPKLGVSAATIGKSCM